LAEVGTLQNRHNGVRFEKENYPPLKARSPSILAEPKAIAEQQFDTQKKQG